MFILYLCLFKFKNPSIFNNIYQLQIQILLRINCYIIMKILTYLALVKWDSMYKLNINLNFNVILKDILSYYIFKRII